MFGGLRLDRARLQRAQVKRAGWGLFALGVLALTIGFNLPLPHNDDLFYATPGRVLHDQGLIANPLERAWWSLTPFYAYPPGYAGVVAAWSAAFGFSSASLSALYGAAVLAFSAGWRRLTRNAGAWTFWLGVGSFVSGTVGTGYRADAPALALAFAGAALAMSVRPALLVLGGLCLAWALLTGPDGVVFYGALGLYALWRRERPDLEVRDRLRPLLWIALGGLVALAGCALLIHGRFDLLWSDLAVSARRSAQHIGALSDLLSPQSITAFCIALLCAPWPGRSGGAQRATGSGLLFVMALALAVTPLVEAGFVYVSVFTLLVFTGAAARIDAMAPGPVGRLRLASGLAALLLLLTSLPWLYFGVHRQVLPLTAYDGLRRMALVEQKAGKTVVIDPVVARAAYDERPPLNFLDWNFALPMAVGDEPTDTSAICRGSDWLISPYHVSRFLPDLFDRPQIAPTGVRWIDALASAPGRHFILPTRAWDAVLLTCSGGRVTIAASTDPRVRLKAP